MIGTKETERHLAVEEFGRRFGIPWVIELSKNMSEVNEWDRAYDAIEGRIMASDPTIDPEDLALAICHKIGHRPKQNFITEPLEGTLGIRVISGRNQLRIDNNTITGQFNVGIIE